MNINFKIKKPKDFSQIEEEENLLFNLEDFYLLQESKVQYTMISSVFINNNKEKLILKTQPINLIISTDLVNSIEIDESQVIPIEDEYNF